MKDCVLITGAGTGIGRHSALALARQGYHVYAGVLTPEEGRSLANEGGENITPLTLDVTEREDIHAARRRVEDDGRALKAVINNAGIVVLSPAEFVPEEDLRRNLEVTYLGSVFVTQELLPLIRRDRGRLIFVGSISARFPAPFQGAYAASKAALNALTDSMRMELSLWDIPVSMIEPGAIATPLWETTADAAKKRFASFSETARRLYEPHVSAVWASSEKLKAARVGPELVHEAIQHALTAPVPRARYYVGQDARMQNLMSRFLPDRLKDWMILRFLGLRKGLSADVSGRP